MSDRPEQNAAPEKKEKEFVLEDILREFHTDEAHVPAPEEPIVSAPKAEDAITPSLLDETFDAEMEQSLRVIFGKSAETVVSAKKKESGRTSRRDEKRRQEDAAESDATPFSSDIFNEVYEEHRAEPEPENRRTTTVRIRRHGLRDTRTMPVIENIEGMERLGEGHAPEPHVDPDALLSAMSRSLRSVNSRLPITVLLCLPLLYLTLAMPLGLPIPAFLSYVEHPFLYVFTGLLFMTAVGIAGLDILTNGFYCLFCLRPGGDSLIALSYLASLLHCAGIIFFPKGGGYLPVCLLPALSVVFSLMGDQYNLKARILSLRAALRQEDSECTTLMRDTAKKNDPLYLRAGVADRTAFYDHLNHSDPVSRSMVWFAPAAILVALVCAVICAVRTGTPAMFLWSFSMITAITPLFSLYTCCALPYLLMTRKCHKHGAAVGSCDAVAEFARRGSFVVTDGDLYPSGSVKMGGYKMLSSLPKELVLALTEAALRASGTSTAPLFTEILKEECIPALQASTVEFSGHGGIRAEVDDYPVLVGTANFMQKAAVALPDGVPTRNTVFVAVNMQPAAAFSLRYEHFARVSRAIDVLVRGGRAPRLASRNFAVTAEVAEENFHCAEGSLTPLATETQVALNNPDRTVEAEAVLFLREGISAPAVFLECARRYARIVRISTTLSLVFAFLGCALMGLITAMGWTSSVTPWHMLFYMLALSLPGWLLGFWVSKF
ncbi:MAG: hypothetical protein IJC53_08730 [Clostridia bacterium]|nr:hypothetical protein [Clostridia bacterium]